MDNKRAYRRFMRQVKIRNRVHERMASVRAELPSPDYWLQPEVQGSLSKTAKRCGNYCCKSCEGPTIQERRNEEFQNIL